MVFGIVMLSIIAGAVSLLVPVPEARSWVNFHSYLGLSLVTAVLYIGASLLFIKGLDGFTDKLKRAYIFICIGFSLFGFAQIELPVLISLDQLDSLWRQSGIIGLPFVAAVICLYIGTRIFSHLFNIRDFTTTIWFATLGPVSLIMLFSVLPHAPISGKEVVYDASNAVSVWNFFTAGLCAFFIYRVRKVAGVAYINALAWLAVTFTLMTVTAGIYLIAVSVLGDGQTELIAALTLVPLGLAGAVLLRSAYAFNYISANTDIVDKSVARSFFGKPLVIVASRARTSLDIVTYAANLASDYRAVDPILDGLRHLTATLAPGQPLSEVDQLKLMGIYVSIEEYLLQKEPIRTFTKESLRQQIAQKLQLSPADTTTFWGRLMAEGSPSTQPVSPAMSQNNISST